MKFISSLFLEGEESLWPQMYISEAFFFTFLLPSWKFLLYSLLQISILSYSCLWNTNLMVVVVEPPWRTSNIEVCCKATGCAVCPAERSLAVCCTVLLLTSCSKSPRAISSWFRSSCSHAKFLSRQFISLPDQSVQISAVQLVKHATKQSTGNVSTWMITSSLFFFLPL